MSECKSNPIVQKDRYKNEVSGSEPPWRHVGKALSLFASQADVTDVARNLVAPQIGAVGSQEWTHKTPPVDSLDSKNGDSNSGSVRDSPPPYRVPVDLR